MEFIHINGNLKKIIIPSIIAIFAFIVIFLIVSIEQYESFNEIYNSKIEQIIGKVKEEYPEIDEKDIIDILQSKDNEKEGQEFFEKFGYTEDMQWSMYNFYMSKLYKWSKQANRRNKFILEETK